MIKNTNLQLQNRHIFALKPTFGTIRLSCTIRTIHPLALRLRYNSVLSCKPRYLAFNKRKFATNFDPSARLTYFKNKPIFITLRFDQIMNNEYLLSSITSSNVYKGNTYYVLIKVRYDSDKYYMTGNQFAFVYDSDSNITILQDDIIKSLSKLLDEYDLTEDDIIYFQLIFKLIDRKFLSDLSYDPISVDNKNKTILNRQVKLFPLDVNPNLLGKPLDCYTMNGVVESLVVYNKQ